MLLAIDPGLRGCGVALFNLSGEIARAAFVQSGVRDGKGPPVWNAMAAAVVTWCPAPLLVAIEEQQINRRRTRNPASILQLTGAASAISAFYAARGVQVRSVPLRWKGTVDPDVMTRRIEESMSPEERARVEEQRVTLRHNVIDAVGIGKWLFEFMGNGLFTATRRTP